MRKEMLNAFILLGAAAVGAAGMWFWNDQVQKFEVRLVEQQLMQGVQQPAVDVHKLGLHGEFADMKLASLEEGHAEHDGHDHHGHSHGPSLTSDQEKRLHAAAEKAREIFATPGGAYTQADIARNGTVPPSVRFDRVQFLYSMKPNPGEPFDPILKTKTAGAFDWSVGGKTYHFASIASLEEFVIRAKRDPKSVLPPESYVQGEDVRVASN